MPKKFTNVIDRGRVTANKYNLTNNGDGTAIITDIESNINVPGTPLNKELFNPMQEGLIFTVETVHTIENSTDVYELEIDGLQGTSNLNGMPLFKGLSFNIKISETNTTNVVKIKISGNKYDLAKESGDTVVNLTVGELKRNRYYKVIFDSVRFTIPVEIIEYNPMFGANFGGLLGTLGTKKVGVAYYDVANNQTVVPTIENSLTYFESSKFIPISDYQTAKKLEKLSGITALKGTEIDSRITNYFSAAWLYKIGDIVIFSGLLDKNLPLINTPGTVLLNLRYTLREDTWVEPFFTIRKNGNLEIGAYATYPSNKINSPKHVSFMYITNS